MLLRVSCLVSRRHSSAVACSAAVPQIKACIYTAHVSLVEGCDLHAGPG